MKSLDLLKLDRYPFFRILCTRCAQKMTNKLTSFDGDVDGPFDGDTDGTLLGLLEGDWLGVDVG